MKNDWIWKFISNQKTIGYVNIILNLPYISTTLKKLQKRSCEPEQKKKYLTNQVYARNGTHFFHYKFYDYKKNQRLPCDTTVSLLLRPYLKFQFKIIFFLDFGKTGMKYKKKIAGFENSQFLTILGNFVPEYPVMGALAVCLFLFKIKSKQTL